jgi:hypothetical protein
LDLIQHLLELQYFATEAHTIVTQDENGDKIGDCEQLLTLMIEQQVSAMTYEREYHSIVIFACILHNESTGVESESDTND